MTEREAMAVLVSAKGIYYAQREQLLSHMGSATAVLEDPHACADRIGAEGAGKIRKAVQNADRLLDTLYESGTHLLICGQKGYPERLMQSAKPPHLLFVQGAPDLCDPMPLSIVGTRQADVYGIRHTRQLAEALARNGLCIISGLAIGVDAAAHMGALDGEGRTIAVLGGALDKLFPKENSDLLERILENGGSVVSEYPPGCAPTRFSFIQRNRIVAGLSLGVLVTQAPMRSGAQSTVQYALDNGREVFAMPGDIDRIGSQLPNRLIAEGARMVQCAQDILETLVAEPANIAPSAQPKGSALPKKRKLKTENGPQMEKPTQPSNVRVLDTDEQRIFDLLVKGEKDFDALCEGTGMASDALGSLLTMMELDGLIEALPGAMYRLL